VVSLENRILNRSCKKLPKDCTQKERKDAHRVKMEMKEILRSRLTTDKEHIFANISQNHPDYGMTPREHAEAKLQKNNS